MRWLAILLFAPWFAILLWAYWTFPRGLARTAARRMFDACAILLAIAAGIIAMLIGHDANIGVGGSIWKQVAASTTIYGAFLGSLLVAVLVRARIWKRAAPTTER